MHRHLFMHACCILVQIVSSVAERTSVSYRHKLWHDMTTSPTLLETHCNPKTCKIRIN